MQILLLLLISYCFSLSSGFQRSPIFTRFISPKVSVHRWNKPWKQWHMLRALCYGYWMTFLKLLFFLFLLFFNFLFVSFFSLERNREWTGLIFKPYLILWKKLFYIISRFLSCSFEGVEMWRKAAGLIGWIIREMHAIWL